MVEFIQEVRGVATHYICQIVQVFFTLQTRAELIPILQLWVNTMVCLQNCWLKKLSDSLHWLVVVNMRFHLKVSIWALTILCCAVKEAWCRLTLLLKALRLKMYLQ